MCAHGALGLITSPKPQQVTYPNGETAQAWCGIHLTDRTAAPGAPWSSRCPRVLGYVEDFEHVGLEVALEHARRHGGGLCFTHDAEADGERVRSVVMTPERYEQLAAGDEFAHTHLTPDDLR